jgi:hypothetical protein
MGKDSYTISKITKKQAKEILMKYHYLKDISKGFKSGFNYGLFTQNKLVGVIIYTGFPVPELAVGMLGLNRDEQQGLFELSRLCLDPEVQSIEHNLASWFVSKSIKLLKKETLVKVILSYADCDFHKGTVYRACNFKYYGKSKLKKDFFIKQPDGSYIKHNRGKIKGLDGEWRERTQKHRFVIVFDKTLTIKYKQEKHSDERI